jgi:hypothetical protein
VTATVVLLTLLLAPDAAGGAQAPPAAGCQSFSRDAETSPPLVREWFARSADERVLVCPQSSAPGASAPLYFGEGAVTQHGEVCSYLSHGLTLVGSGDTARLRRYERSEALAMALAGAGCPRPHGASAGAAYVETYDVTAAAFVGIMRLWSAATASLAAAANEHCCAARGEAAGQPGAAAATIAPEARTRLEAAISPGHLSAATVTRIVRIPGSVLRHRYALFLTVPDATAGSPALYVVYVDKSLRGPYEITAFAETN